VTLILLGILLLLQVADAASTIYVLLKFPGRTKEANGIVRWFHEKLGVAGGTLAVKVPVMVLLAVMPLPQWLLAVGCAFYVWVVYSNVTLIQKMRQ
jgi:hypothetical protein